MNEICVENIVQINQSLVDELTGADLLGWKGIVRLVFDPDETSPEKVFLIDWTAETLENAPDNYFIDSFEGESDWSNYFVPESIIERVDEPFHQTHLEWVKNAIGQKYFWQAFGRDGKLIETVFQSAPLQPEQSPYDYWRSFLQERLQFPAHAVVTFDYGAEDGILKAGDTVTIHGISSWDYPLGVFADVEKDGQSFILPLQDLEGSRKTPGKNNRTLEAYLVWMSCRA